MKKTKHDSAAESRALKHLQIMAAQIIVYYGEEFLSSPEFKEAVKLGFQKFNAREEALENTELNEIDELRRLSEALRAEPPLPKTWIST